MPHNGAQRLAISYLLKSLRAKKWDVDWKIKPGTVLRCDIEVEGELGLNTSVTFASVADLHAAKLNRKKLYSPKETESQVSHPRRLCEAFGRLDQSMDQDRMQHFRGHEGSKEDEILWVGQTWLLITSAGEWTDSFLIS